MEENIQILTEQLATCNKKLEMLENERSDMVKNYDVQLAESKKEIACLEGEIKKQSSESEAAEQLLSEKVSRSIDLETYENFKLNMEARLSSLTEEREALLSAMNKLKEEKEEAEGEIIQHNDTFINAISNAEIEHNETKIKLTEAKNINKSLMDENSGLHSETRKLEDQLSKQAKIIATANVEYKKIETELAAANTTIQKLQDEIQKLENERYLTEAIGIAETGNHTLKIRLANADQIITELREKIKKLESKNCLTEEHSSSDELRTELGRTKQLLSDNSQKIFELEEKCVKLQNEKNELACKAHEEEQQYKELIKDHNAAQAELESLNKELSQVMEEHIKIQADSKIKDDSNKEKYSQLLLKLSETEEALTVKENALLQLTEDNAAASKRYETLANQLAELKRSSSDDVKSKVSLQQLLEEKKIEVREFKGKCIELQNDKNELSSNLQAYQEKHDDLLQKYDIAQAELESLSKELLQATEEHLKIQSDSKIKDAANEEKYSELLLKLSKNEETLTVKENALLQLTEESDALSKRNETLTNQLAELDRLSSDDRNTKLSLQQLLEDKKIEVQNFEEKSIILQNDKSELSSKLQEYQQKYDELLQKFEDASNEEKYSELLLKLSETEEALTVKENALLQLTEDRDAASKKYETLANQLAELKRSSSDDMKTKVSLQQLLEGKKIEVQEFKEKCIKLQNDKNELSSNLQAYQEKYEGLIEKHDTAQAELESINKELLQATEEHIKIQSDSKLKDAVNEEKYSELLLKLRETEEALTNKENDVLSLTEKLDAASKSSETLANQLAELSSSHTESRNIQVELSKTVTEQGSLISVLELSKSASEEMIKNYSEKIAVLENKVAEVEDLNCSLKNELKKLNEDLVDTKKSLNILDEQKEEAEDMKRQIKEKEDSIEQLEKALNDTQNLLKESELKAKQQIQSVKLQYSGEIEELKHLNKISKTENSQLKTTVTKLENEAKEKKVMAESTKTKATKGRKRSLSEAAQDENQDDGNSKPQFVKERKDVQDNENRRKRQPLRQKQPVGYKFEDSDSGESDTDKDEDFMLKKEKTTRKKVVPAKEKQLNKQPSKKALKVEPTDIKRTSSRRLKENEPTNSSPIKKAMAFVSSTLRNVAQNSPRMTRGRKKLFNADAGSPAVEKKAWKI